MACADSDRGGEFRDAAEPVPTGFGLKVRRVWGYLRIVLPNLRFWARVDRIVKATPEPYRPHLIPEDFFGINVAAGTSTHDDIYVLTGLHTLGVRRVRIDYGYGEDSRVHARRLIERMHKEGFSVLLHVIQPMKEAARMGQSDADARWSSFLDETLRWAGKKIAACEIGSAVNRFSWAGYTVSGYIQAVRIADKVCRRHGVRWFGPSITDFEPGWNLGILHLLSRAGLKPHAHTDNLFVDRVVEPENIDTSSCTTWLGGRLEWDLPGKARFLHTISRLYDIPLTYCTYTYWTLSDSGKTTGRFVSLEKYAEYLVRYCVLAAACGHLDAMYWGQMISHRKGLIGDGTGYRPAKPIVHHLWRLFGNVEDYEIRPGFHAYRTLVPRVAGAFFRRRVPTREGTYLFEFGGGGSSGERFLVGWTRDGQRDELNPYLQDPVVRMEDIHGQSCNRPVLSESPLYVFMD